MAQEIVNRSSIPRYNLIINHNNITRAAYERAAFLLSKNQLDDYFIQAKYDDNQEESINIVAGSVDHGLTRLFDDYLTNQPLLYEMKDFLIERTSVRASSYVLYIQTGYIELRTNYLLQHLIFARVMKCQRLEIELINILLDQNKTNQLYSYDFILFLSKIWGLRLIYHRHQELMKALISEGQHTLFADQINPKLDLGLRELDKDHFERLLICLQEYFPDKIRIFYQLFLQHKKALDRAGLLDQNKLFEISEIFYRLCSRVIDITRIDIKELAPQHQSEHLLALYTEARQNMQKLTTENQDLKKKLTKTEDLNKCFHFKRNFQCDLINIVIKTECGHNVCVCCLWLYYEYRSKMKSREFQGFGEAKLRCLSRQTCPTLCDAYYQQADYMHLKKYVKVD